MKTINSSHIHYSIMEPRGRLDDCTSGHFENQLKTHLASGVHHLVINCHEIDYISNAGFLVLMKVARQLAGIKGCLILCDLEDYIAEVLEISGLDSCIPVEKSLNNAMKRLSMNEN